ncbi:carboxypeptidase-like regulatory domain-containing protein [Mangrovimonas sp. YM274]|uniref:carboxypeptidase-like regulatory domain-containing protein n=1 Tax=Mangrovimonas sp. YM274 TaxID=3070660 RepID=UPI0027DAFE59|nr:carboxypeptidase-like regulatory domain-containing protein [Mangrovimonas sp. YM274]WMI68375.1 carboxypeptidase-like regulatory domain-containing protein [Mangrovimonas sp. YM274]
MAKSILLLSVLLLSFQVHSQQLNRITVNGRIVVDSDDIEGVTVFNRASNKGTITNEKGEFSIKVAVEDVLEFHALQFEEFEVVIDQEIIMSKQLTVFLVEKVNMLDEVVVLPYDLSGNLMVDVESVKIYNADLKSLDLGLGNMDEFEFRDNADVGTENLVKHSQAQTMKNGLNIKNIVSLLLIPLFDSPNNSKNDKDTTVDVPMSTFKSQYSEEFLEQNFGIPKNQIDNFIIYVEDSGLDYSLLDEGKELQFLEYINDKSKLFLSTQSGKN